MAAGSAALAVRAENAANALDSGAKSADPKCAATNGPDMAWYKRFGVLFVITLAFTLFMALSPQPPKMFLDVFGDKVKHASAFVSLAILARLTFIRLPNWQLLERLMMLGALIEFIQAIPALHRDCDWKDLMADLAGIVIGLSIAWLAGARQVLPAQPPTLAPALSPSRGDHG